MTNSISQKIACMKSLTTTNGLTRLKEMVTLTKDSNMPVRMYQSYFDSYVENEEQMTSNTSHQYLDALKNMYETFSDTFENFETKVIEKSSAYTPFWKEQKC